MLISYIQKIGWFVGLVLLQVLILNNVHIAGYATPFLYIYLLLKFESTVSRNELMLWAFSLGLIIDIFSNTPGMNAAAAVFLAFIRPLLLRMFMTRDAEIFVPGIHSMGFNSFLKYLLAGVLLHHIFLISLEFFSFASLGILLVRIIASTLLTTVCLLALEGIRR
ncbi:MAG: rod shape-determining protein MreD [Bacteroides sp.]|nr:rod shape-determining protein MreD [Bacteroides sp.]